jgi:hypothetical protein
MGIQTATNPDTGARVALVGGEWKPIEQSATNPQGIKAYKIGGSWMTDESAPAPAAPAPSNEGIPSPRSVGGFLGNVGSSYVKTLEGLGQQILHPIDTANAVVDTLAGAVQNVLPKAVVDFIHENEPAALAQADKHAVEVANAVGGDYKRKYGSFEALANTLYTDPVGAAADLSMLFTGGASATRKAGMANTASGLTTAAAYTNPLTPIVKAGSIPFKAGAKTAGYVSNMLAPKETALLNAAEGQGPQIVNALRNYDEMVAGAQPTSGAIVSGQIIAPKYAALQDQVSKLMPREYMERNQANVAARRAAIKNIAQDKAAIKTKETARTNVTKPLYEAADTGVADVSNVASTLDSLIANNPGNRSLVRELKQIRNDLVDKTTGELRTNAKEVTSVIDGIKTRLAKEDNKFIGGKLRDVREMLVDAVPGYRAAQEKFAEMSKPINIMQVGQYLEGKLTPAIETSIGERAGVFSAAVKEAPTTIKRSTGNSRFDVLDQILDPKQIKIVEGIRNDLAREAEFTKQAREGGKAGEIFPATETARIPNFMSRITTVANTILTKLQGKIDKKLAVELATEMLDPNAAAAAMEKALARQAKGEKLANKFKTRGATAFEGLRGPTALGLTQMNNALSPENQNNLGR